MFGIVKNEPKPGITWRNVAAAPAPGHGEVTIAVRKAGICGTDYHIFAWDRWSAARVPTPMVIGHECVGHIVATGPGVAPLIEGQRVSVECHIACGHCVHCRTGNTHICENVRIIGIDRPGCFAEAVTVPAANVWPVPDAIPDRHAAVFDFDVKGGFSIRVSSTDSGGLSITKTFTITINDVNETPTDISLSSTSVAENLAIGTPVGILSTVDEDTGDTHTYTLVPGLGDTDNALFAIVGVELRTNAVFDFEVKSSFSIRVSSIDSGGLSITKTFTITINDANDAPTEIDLSSTSVDENVPSSAVVGILSSTDEDTGDVHTYSFAVGLGDTDNALFAIVGVELRANAVFDFEDQPTRTIRVKTDDGNGGTFQKAFTITINDVNETPTPLPTSTFTPVPPQSLSSGGDAAISRRIAFRPDIFTFEYNKGTKPPEPQIIRIWNSSRGRTLRFSVSSDVDWLEFDPVEAISTNDNDKEDVEITVDVDGLEVGTFEANLTISAMRARNDP
ncbi:MAG: alcohol dehydrogenase catalytic domain-containing protein, partial [Proteobacteria bacterium]|nr:alcohol dehydrogenase catalytic domain-containing protein [Pseudomonadota bacterium]